MGNLHCFGFGPIVGSKIKTSPQFEKLAPGDILQREKFFRHDRNDSVCAGSIKTMVPLCGPQQVWHGQLVGGFNPFEKYQSNWIISPGRGENNKYLKPPPSPVLNLIN